LNNLDFLNQALERERNTEGLAFQDIERINRIRANTPRHNEEIHNLILEIKILRMKKICERHNRIILTKDQAGEIWK